MTDEQKAALHYLAASVSAYANTMPEPVRVPFARECQAALNVVEAGLTPKPLIPQGQAKP